MTLSLRLTLASLTLIALSFSPISFLIEKPGGFVCEAVRHASLSLAKGIKNELSFFLSLRTLNTEKAAISDEVAKLRGELAYLKEVERENKRLKKQLGLGTTKKKGLILAQVTGFSLEQEGALLVISEGRDGGLEVDDLVVLENYLVGTVERVEASRSLVRLISDPRFSVAALDQSSPERPRGIVWGSFGTKLRMEKILPGERVSVGDLIISSGLDGKVPLGLILGEVTQVVSSEGGILKEAELKLLFNPSKLEEVFIRK